MKKLLLLTTLVLTTMIASAQFMAITTINKIEGADPTEPCTTPGECEVYDGNVCPTASTEDSWNVTDKIGIGYIVNDKFMVGVTMDGEDKYELLGRYTVKDALWATCIYNYEKDSEAEMKDNLEVGVGYSLNVWKGLYVDPNYTMPVQEDEEGNREGSFNLSISYRF